MDVMAIHIIASRPSPPSWWPAPGEIRPFNVIGGDWPWHFEVHNDETGSGRSAAKHYNTKKLDWRDHAEFIQWLWPFMAPNCALAWWMCRPSQDQAIEDIKYAWNGWIAAQTNWSKRQTRFLTELPRVKDELVYKTELFTLAKFYNFHRKDLLMSYDDETGEPDGYDDTQVGTGYYTRGNTEPCMLFVRGRMPRKDAGVRQIIKVYPHLLPEQSRHSYKPPVWRRRLDRMYPGGDKLELFARENPQEAGWTHLGDFISGEDIRADLERIALSRIVLDTRLQEAA
jgi:hypothetical protein